MYRDFVSLLSSTCGTPCNVRELLQNVGVDDSSNKRFGLSFSSYLHLFKWLNFLAGRMNGNVRVLQDTYHYCNMPHVGSAGFATYPLPPSNMDLLYVEVVQRHHKRTPYASNTFPHEDISWSCDDVKLVSYGIPDGTEVASVYVSQ